MYRFIEIVRAEGGEKHFPILTQYLPTANGGIVPSEVAQGFLEELEKLGNSNSSQGKVVLREKDTQRLLVDVDINDDFTFVYTAYNRHHAILSSDGFIITQNKEDEEKGLLRYIVFKSKHFTEQRIGEKYYRFIDIASGKEYECDISILADDEKKDTTCYEFEVVEEIVSISKEYNYIIEPLIKLAKASIESGNPIHWC